MEDKRILISLYEGCQYHCAFCMYGHAKQEHPFSEKDTLDPQRWSDILRDAYASGFRVVEIGGRGEPTLNPLFTKVVRIAHELGYEVQLLSNALNDKAIIEILPCLRHLTINLNVVDEHGMAEIHQPAPGFSFDRCITSVKNVVRSVSQNNLNIQLRINYVITTQSLRDAFSFPQNVRSLLAAELGNRPMYIHYQHVHTYIKTPKNLGFDYEGLQKILRLAQLNNSRKFLLENTNLVDFIKMTEKLIEKVKPISKKSAGSGSGCSNHYSCDAHQYIVFIDGNGDCYGCYNPFRAVNGLPIDKDPFFFGNLKQKSFGEIFIDRNGFNPLIDVSKPYWQPCLLCVAKEIPVKA